MDAGDDDFVRIGICFHGAFCSLFWCGGAISESVFDHENVLEPFTVTVVTGGSSGMGKTFISLLAEASPRMAFCNLSRRAPMGLPETVEKRVLHVPCVLGKTDLRAEAMGGAERFIRQDHYRSKVLLINNSGFGSCGNFTDAERETQLDMLEVNVAAVIDLTSRCCPCCASGAAPSSTSHPSPVSSPHRTWRPTGRRRRFC
jgi:hypothetical protein